MESLQQEITRLIEMIDELSNLYLTGKKAAPQKMMPQLMEQIGVVFPAIVDSYQLKELEAVQGDYTYWVDELNRIAEIISCDDKFLILDILNFETKDNLLRYEELRGFAKNAPNGGNYDHI